MIKYIKKPIFITNIRHLFNMKIGFILCIDWRVITYFFNFISICFYFNALWFWADRWMYWNLTHPPQKPFWYQHILLYRRFKPNCPLFINFKLLFWNFLSLFIFCVINLEIWKVCMYFLPNNVHGNESR